MPWWLSRRMTVASVGELEQVIVKMEVFATPCRLETSSKHFLNMHIDKEHQRSISFISVEFSFIPGWSPWLWEWSDTHYVAFFLRCGGVFCCYQSRLKWLWGSIRVTWQSLLTPHWHIRDGEQMGLKPSCPFHAIIIENIFYCSFFFQLFKFTENIICYTQGFGLNETLSNSQPRTCQRIQGEHRHIY